MNSRAFTKYTLCCVPRTWKARIGKCVSTTHASQKSAMPSGCPRIQILSLPLLLRKTCTQSSRMGLRVPPLKGAYSHLTRFLFTRRMAPGSSTIQPTRMMWKSASSAPLPYDRRSGINEPVYASAGTEGPATVPWQEGKPKKKESGAQHIHSN